MIMIYRLDQWKMPIFWITRITISNNYSFYSVFALKGKRWKSNISNDIMLNYVEMWWYRCLWWYMFDLRHHFFCSPFVKWHLSGADRGSQFKRLVMNSICCLRYLCIWLLSRGVKETATSHKNNGHKMHVIHNPLI